MHEICWEDILCKHGWDLLFLKTLIFFLGWLLSKILICLSVIIVVLQNSCLTGNMAHHSMTLINFCRLWTAKTTIKKMLISFFIKWNPTLHPLDAPSPNIKQCRVSGSPCCRSLCDRNTSKTEINIVLIINCFFFHNYISVLVLYIKHFYNIPQITKVGVQYPTKLWISQTSSTVCLIILPLLFYNCYVHTLIRHRHLLNRWCPFKIKPMLRIFSCITVQFCVSANCYTG